MRRPHDWRYMCASWERERASSQRAPASRGHTGPDVTHRRYEPDVSKCSHRLRAEARPLGAARGTHAANTSPLLFITSLTRARPRCRSATKKIPCLALNLNVHYLVHNSPPQPTPWSKVLEKLIVAQPVKNFPIFYGIPMFNALITKAHQLHGAKTFLRSLLSLS